MSSSESDLPERMAVLEAGLGELLGAVQDAATSADLEELSVKHLGRRSEASQIASALGGAPESLRPLLGQRLSSWRARLEGAVTRRRAELVEREESERLAREHLDLTLPGRRRHRGTEHLLMRVQREVEDIFVGLGYRIAEGPEVETDWFCFEALNLPKIHPARSMQDTLYVESPGSQEEVLLRSHTSSVQIRTMLAQKPPVYILAPGRAARRDTADATHSPVFHQFEGLAVDRDITLGDLAGTLEHLARALFGAKRELRLRPSYFPYTEPSAEIDVSCFICGGSGNGPSGERHGCRTCKGSGWIEMGGSGMVHPQVFRNVGYDPEEVQGFAFGIGLERIALLRHGIPDIRLFMENDLRFLEQFR
jgi:phenylalanyl-tRNA synthetase alpha chain